MYFKKCGHGGFCFLSLTYFWMFCDYVVPKINNFVTAVLAYYFNPQLHVLICGVILGPEISRDFVFTFIRKTLKEPVLVPTQRWFPQPFQLP